MWCLDDHYVKFIGIVRAWRKDSIFDSFLQGLELLHATPTDMENLNLAVQNYAANFTAGHLKIQ